MAKFSMLDTEKEYGREFDNLYETKRVMGAANARAYSYFGWKINNQKHIKTNSTVYSSNKALAREGRNAIDVAFEGTEYILRRRRDIGANKDIYKNESKFEKFKNKNIVRPGTGKTILYFFLFLIFLILGAAGGYWFYLNMNAEFGILFDKLNDFNLGEYAKYINLKYLVAALSGILVIIALVLFITFCRRADYKARMKRREKKMFRCLNAGKEALENIRIARGVPSKEEKKMMDAPFMYTYNLNQAGEGGGDEE